MWCCRVRVQFQTKPRISQMEGREDLFERERHKEPAPGWHCCELACAELNERPEAVILQFEDPLGMVKGRALPEAAWAAMPSP